MGFNDFARIGAHGLLSYSDYCFLLSLLSTPKRFIATAFNLFDVSGDGNIDAKVLLPSLDFTYQYQEFAFVSTKMAHKAGGFGAYTETDQEEILASSSGLLNYIFGKDRQSTLNRYKQWWMLQN